MTDFGSPYVLFYKKDKGNYHNAAVAPFIAGAKGPQNGGAYPIGGWETDWTQIATFEFGDKPYLLFYKGNVGNYHNAAVAPIVAGPNGPQNGAAYPIGGWENDWTQITTFEFGGNPYLLFYKANGLAAVAPIVAGPNGPQNGAAYPIGGWENDWTEVECFEFAPQPMPQPILDLYHRHNGPFGRFGPLVGPAQHAANGVITQKTLFGNLTLSGNGQLSGQTSYVVNAGLAAVKCFGTLANWPDDSDALYAVVSLVPIALSPLTDGPAAAPVTIVTPIADIHKGEIKLQNVVIGSVPPAGAGVFIHIALWQHKAGDPNKIRDAIHAALNDVVNAASQAAQAVVGDPGNTGGTAGDISSASIGGFSVNDATLGIANAIVNQFFADRLIGEHVFNLYATDITTILNNSGTPQSSYTDPGLAPDIRVNWPPSPAVNPIINVPGNGASYKAYFDVTVTTAVTTVL